MTRPIIKVITILAMSVIFLLFAGLAIVFWGRKTPSSQNIEKSAANGCLSSPQDYVMIDSSMENVLYAGKTYSTFTNWQRCLQLQKGDVVLYRYSPAGTPIARSIAAVPGDKIELVRNPEKNNWNLKINGSIYETNGQPYSFGSSADHPISLYEKAHKGLLDGKSYVIFANKAPGGRDSSEFGVVSINDIVSIVANYPTGEKVGGSMVKSFIVEFLITAPLLIIISYVCVRLLQKELGARSPGRATLVVSIGLIAAFTIARAMPFITYKIAPPSDPASEQTNALKRKDEFLKVLDALVADQSKLTKENKDRLFAEFKDLFPNGAKDRQVYYQNLSTFVDCNMAYFQDALQALKTKVNQKSEMRQKCQALDGLFFNRAKMVPEEQAKVNDQVIETIAKGKKIMQDNKEVEINVGTLQQALEIQSRSKETLKVIFAEGP